MALSSRPGKEWSGNTHSGTLPYIIVNICHFTSTFFPRIGGVEIVVSNLARQQTELGHRVMVLTPRIRGTDNHVELPYRVAHYSRPSSKRYLTRQVLFRLLWEHFRMPFDVLHCHSAYPHGYVASTFSQLTGVPVVITPHGPTDILRDEQIRKNPKLLKRLAKGLRTATSITAISQHIDTEIMSVGGIGRDKVFVIPNGVTLADFEGVEPYRHKCPYIFAMGRMVPQKGFDLLIHAFARVIEKTENLNLLLAGEGVHRQDYERLAKELGLGGRVEFLGLVQGRQKVAFMEGAEFFVCPSRFEPFGIVVLEALAAGVPVIAHRVGGIVDIVEEGVEGHLVNPENTRELADKILDLHSSPDRRAQFAKMASIKAQDYDWTKINQRYMDVYYKGMETRKRKKQAGD